MTVRMREECPLASLTQLAHQVPEQPARPLVQRQHTTQVHHQLLDLSKPLDDVLHHHLGRRKRQVPLQLVHPDGPPGGPQCGQFFRGPDPARIQVRAGELAPDRRLAGRRTVEQVKVPVARQLIAREDPPNAVAPRIQPRRIDPDPNLPRQHRDHPARHAALRRDSHPVDPVARRIVHAAGRHHAQHVLHVLPTQRDLPGHRIDPAIRQRRRHDPQVPTCHGHRALLEVKIHRLHRVALEHVVVPQHVPDRPVPVSRFALGPVHRFVEFQRSARVARKHLDHALQTSRLALAANQPRGRNRAGIDHRVAGATCLRFEADRVERIACRLDTHLFQHWCPPVVLQRQPVHERLRNRLDRERQLGITHLVDRAVRGHQADAEPVRIRLCQLRDVGRHSAFIHAQQRFIQLPQKIEDGRCGRACRRFHH